MFIKGSTEYSKDGKETQTGLVAAAAIRDGEVRTTSNGKEIGSVSVKAMSRKDGSAVFITVKGWGRIARQIAAVNKGDPILAAGRIENREYNGKTYTDLTCDFFLVGAEAKQQEAGSTEFNLIGEDEGDLPF